MTKAWEAICTLIVMVGAIAFVALGILGIAHAVLG